MSTHGDDHGDDHGGDHGRDQGGPEAETRGIGPNASTEGVPALEPLTQDAGSAGTGLNIRMHPRYEWGSVPAGTDPYLSVLLTLTPEGQPIVRSSTGPVAHVILALDVSASMDCEDKYPVLRKALERMLGEMQDPSQREVLLSVVAFAWGASVLFRAVPASSLTTEKILTAIDGSDLLFTRYTDIGGALQRAGRIAYSSNRRHPALPCRIYLMTDGKPQDLDLIKRNLGTVELMPVDIDALAFGSDANVSMLQEMVGGRRGGTVKHVREETLSEAYGRIAEVAQRVVAKRATLRLELREEVAGAVAYRFRPARHSFGETSFEQGQVFETDLGTLESGREYSLLFQIRLPQTEDDLTAIGDVNLRVRGTDGYEEFTCALAIPRHRGTMPTAADPVVVEARQVLEALDDTDPESLLRSLRARRRMYLSERRDPYLLKVVDKAIDLLEQSGSLDSLTDVERAALTAHTATVRADRPTDGRREYSFG